LIRAVLHLVGILASASSALFPFIVFHRLLLIPDAGSSMYGYEEESGDLLVGATWMLGGFALWMVLISMARPESHEPAPAAPGSFFRSVGWALFTAGWWLGASIVLSLRNAIVGYDGDGSVVIVWPALVVASGAVFAWPFAVRAMVRLGATPAPYPVAGFRALAFAGTMFLVGLVLALLSIDELRGGQATMARVVATGLILGSVRGVAILLFRREPAAG
jgi:hypothetical protein